MGLARAERADDFFDDQWVPRVVDEDDEEPVLAVPCLFVLNTVDGGHFWTDRYVLVDQDLLMPSTWLNAEAAWGSTGPPLLQAPSISVLVEALTGPTDDLVPHAGVFDPWVLHVAEVAGLKVLAPPGHEAYSMARLVDADGDVVGLAMADRPGSAYALSQPLDEGLLEIADAICDGGQHITRRAAWRAAGRIANHLERTAP